MTTAEKVVAYALGIAYLERLGVAEGSRRWDYFGGVADGVGDVARDLLTPPVWIDLDARGRRLARLWAAAGIDPREARERWQLAGMGRRA